MLIAAALADYSKCPLARSRRGRCRDRRWRGSALPWGGFSARLRL